ncbi:MAG: peptidoglycan-binding protein [Neomegalonema sp.]|nr:peptidoglycan-binding protein [Neomegalonema sp.]
MNPIKFIIAAGGVALVAGCASTSTSVSNEPSLFGSTQAQADASMAAEQTGALPPNAKPGECYARVVSAAQYKTVEERVVEREAAERTVVVPATYRTVMKDVVVTEASERIEVVPATYKTVVETVVVEPERTELRTIPASYKSVQERVLVSPARTEWKRGAQPYGVPVLDQKTSATGEVLCLVEIPAQYRTETKRVIDQAERTETITIPAVTRTISKRVVDTPATTRKITIPAVTRKVEVQEMVTPASTRAVPVPASFKTVSKRELVSPEKTEWVSVLCETNTAPSTIRRLQQVLQARGLYADRIDGVYGRNTAMAVAKFQRQNNLIGNGALTIETLQKLGFEV